MSKILICIPHLTARSKYLENCLEGYRTRTARDIRFSIVEDAPSCGVGWQRSVELGLAENTDIGWVHFSNDDIVVGANWDIPLIEAVQAGCVPAPRIEPAGGHVGAFDEHTPPMPPSDYPPPTCSGGYFYSDLPENQPTQDWAPVDHGNLPFCSVEQWKVIGPFIPTHFGTDVWFYHRARALGYPVVARQGSVIYNYCAQLGRDFGDWTQIDMLDFDLVFALKDYEEGRLGPNDRHPMRNTPEGLKLVRTWRMKTFPPPHHWEA